MSTGATILVVDDDEQILGLMKALLRHHGFEPVTASSGGQALEALERIEPDLFLLDLGLAGMEGVDLVDRFRRSDQEAPVIVVSGREPSIEELRRIGPAGIVPKPFEVAELVAAIRRALDPVAC